MYCFFKRHFITVLILPLIGSALLGCANDHYLHGQVIPEENLAKLETGKQNKLAVLRLLGSPSSETLFEDNKWLYMTTKTKDRVFTHDEVIDRDIIIVEFDDNDTLSNITQRNTENSRNITPLPQETRTHGQSLGILDQMLENLGQGFGRVE